MDGLESLIGRGSGNPRFALTGQWVGCAVTIDVAGVGPRSVAEDAISHCPTRKPESIETLVPQQLFVVCRI